MKSGWQQYAYARFPNLSLLFVFASQLLSATRIDSAHYWNQQLQNSTDLNQKAQYYYDLAAEYWYRNIDSTLYFVGQGLQLDTAAVKPLLFGKLLFASAIAKGNQGEADSALFYLKKSKLFFGQHKLMFWENRSLEQIGGLYREIGKLDSALIFLDAAKNYFIEIQDSAYISSVLMNTGHVWLDKGRNVMVLQLYLQAASYDTAFETSVDGAFVKLSMGVINCNLGRLFKEIEHSKQVYYFDQALDKLQQWQQADGRLAEALSTAANF